MDQAGLSSPATACRVLKICRQAMASQAKEVSISKEVLKARKKRIIKDRRGLSLKTAKTSMKLYLNEMAFKKKFKRHYESGDKDAVFYELLGRLLQPCH